MHDAQPIPVIIVGAAGRDFHVFNMLCRDDARYCVVAFTAAQIPDIAGRRYPPELAGAHYPQGVPIEPEADLERLIGDHRVQQVWFAYSDVPYEPHLADLARRVVACGADFRFPDIDATMLRSSKPVIAVTAVRTGCGKSQTARKIATLLRDRGVRVGALRHPMPYGDLARQRVQRFATLQDMTDHDCTIEEIEEYEPYIAAGGVIFAGVDYAAILAAAEAEADVILWDGGNNDAPFIRPDLWITVCDPLRAGDELRYHPSRVNFSRADVLVINKLDSAAPEGVETIQRNAAAWNPGARIVLADSRLTLDGDATLIAGKRVLVVEDGPTCTHGGMTLGAATVAARAHGAADLIDPRPYLVGSLKQTFAQYPDIGPLLPAMGYGDQQRADLAATIAATPCDVVVIGTPIDLARVVPIAKPHLRVRYDLAERGTPDMASLLDEFLAAHRPG